MADLSTTANIRPDLWQAYIGSDTAPHAAAISIAGGYITTDIKPTSIGEVIERMVTGRELAIDFDFYQCAAAELNASLETSSGDALDIGDFLPKKSIRLHDPSASGTTGDIVIHAATFGRIQRTVDGEGVSVLRSTAAALRASDGKFMTIGYTAP